MLLGTVVDMNPTPEPVHDQPPVRTLRASTPDDIAAFVPLALGFVPARSVVMISVGTSGLHARVDLPHDPDDVDDVVEALLRPARRHRVAAVLFVVYDDDTTVADEAVWALREAFEDAGITVKEALRIHDDHWYAVLPGAPLAAYQGVRFERIDHRFTAQGVFDGRVTHASREALRDTLLPDPAAVAVIRSLLDAADEVPLGGLRDLVQGHLTTATTFSDAELAAVAVTVTSGPRRDEVWAWLAGDGALAWCAVDRSRDAEPRHSLAHLVAGLLESATSPAAWETLRPQLDGATDPAA